jgi:succinyl-CoA synthetase alpha subunit
VFNTVQEAVDKTGANCSLIFVPAAFCTDAILEAAAAGISTIVCITEGIPAQDMVMVRNYLQPQGIRMIGPNSPGVITPGQARVGIMPSDMFSPGRVGVISRSGTLLYEAVAQLGERGIGQSTCIGVGGDPIVGTTPLEALRLFGADSDTLAVVLVGEIGGIFEQEAADYIATTMAKPVIAFVAGTTAPPGRRMGHAGAIIAGASGTAQAKKEALATAGAVIVDSPADIGAATQRVLKERRLL